MLAKDLTPEQEIRLGRAAKAVWNYIGADTLRALEECGKKPVMSRSNVIELVVDADRLQEHLNRNAKDHDLLPFLKTADYKEIVKALKPFFPYARYGW